MRSLARISLAVLGLALAQVPDTRADNAAPQPAPGGARKPAAKPAAAWFHKANLCPECKRAELRAKGINVPPPPVNGTINLSAPCDICKLTSITYGPPTMTPAGYPSGTVLMGANGMPGRAVVGGAMEAPGYAVVGGAGSGAPAEPAPIGMMTARNTPPGAFAGRSAPTDRAVMQSSTASVAAPNPIPTAGHNRPHVLSHALGLSAIGRGWRESRDRHWNEKHARIAYGPEEAKVTEVPSYVLSRGR